MPAVGLVRVDTILRLTGVNDQGAFTGVALVAGTEHAITGHFTPISEPSTLVLGLLAPATLRRQHQ